MENKKLVFTVYGIGGIIMLILAIIRQAPYMPVVYGLTCCICYYTQRYAREDTLLKMIDNHTNVWSDVYINKKHTGKITNYGGPVILKTTYRLKKGQRIIAEDRLRLVNKGIVQQINIKKWMHTGYYTLDNYDAFSLISGQSVVDMDCIRLKEKRYNKAEKCMLDIADIKLVDYLISEK